MRKFFLFLQMLAASLFLAAEEGELPVNFHVVSNELKISRSGQPTAAQFRELARRDLHVAVLGCYINPVHPDEEERERQLARFERSLELNKAFGCRIVGTETGSWKGDISYCLETFSDHVFSVFLHSLERMVKAAEANDAICAIEAVAHQHTICSVERMARVLSLFPSDNLRVIWDPVNLVPINGIEEVDGSHPAKPSSELKLHLNVYRHNALAQAVQKGDHVACEAYRQVCSFLAMGIVSLINQLNPGKIVMGGRLAEIHPGLLLDTIYKEVESRTHSLLVGKITLEVNQLHPSPSLLGAGAYAAYQELSHPEHLLTAFADRTALYARARELA